MARKVSKKELLDTKLRNLRKGFTEATIKCINNGICISPECLINGLKWRIVIEIKDKEGGIIERVESDGFIDKSRNKTYSSKLDYEMKVMELYHFYAKDL